MIRSAYQYHSHTSYDRDRMTPHYLDWQNQPTVFKDYPGLTPVELPSEFQLPDEDLSSLLEEKRSGTSTREFNINELSLILYLTSSLTAKASPGSLARVSMAGFPISPGEPP